MVVVLIVVPKICKVSNQDIGIALCTESGSSPRHSDMRHVNVGSLTYLLTQFYLPPTHVSSHGISCACLYSRPQSITAVWSNFTDAPSAATAAPNPLPLNRHHWSNGDCLEGKRENYRSIVCNSCAQCDAHTYEQTKLTVLWIGFCLTGPISLCLDSFLYCVCMLCITVHCIL